MSVCSAFVIPQDELCGMWLLLVISASMPQETLTPLQHGGEPESRALLCRVAACRTRTVTAETESGLSTSVLLSSWLLSLRWCHACALVRMGKTHAKFAVPSQSDVPSLRKLLPNHNSHTLTLGKDLGQFRMEAVFLLWLTSREELFQALYLSHWWQ